MSTVLPPYYHPTTICFVDDNYSFLRSISVDLPNSYPFLSFLHPEEALDIVNQPEPLSPLADRCFSMDNSDPEAPTIRLDLQALEQEIKLIDRFRRISVLLVDYAMPTMSGLEFCEHVQNPQIKIALLTGVADEKTAVAAFNRGIIDRYIPKASLATLSNIVPHVEKLQRQYFEQYTRRLTSNLALNPPRFMTEPAIEPLFREIIARHNIVEYYLTSDPYGYLMLRTSGSMLRLVVLSQAELAAQVELAQRYGAPADMLAQMRNGRKLGYFAEDPADYMGHEVFPWHEVLIDAQRVDGRDVWYLGVVTDPPADIDFDPGESSFEQFLRLDRTFV